MRFGQATLAGLLARRQGALKWDFAGINTKCCPQIDRRHGAKLDRVRNWECGSLADTFEFNVV